MNVDTGEFEFTGAGRGTQAEEGGKHGAPDRADVLFDQRTRDGPDPVADGRTGGQRRLAPRPD